MPTTACSIAQRITTTLDAMPAGHASRSQGMHACDAITPHSDFLLEPGRSVRAAAMRTAGVRAARATRAAPTRDTVARVGAARTIDDARTPAGPRRAG
eukprot:SAG31_NODE_1263_length_9072_cov_9.389390_1_plen_97_part_10